MKERIAFIGAGNVAWHLSHALHAAGYPISAIVSKRKSSAKKLAQRFHAPFGLDPVDILGKETCLFITTPDAAISVVARYLCSRKILKEGQLIIHTSGLYGAELIQCVKRMGAIPLSMHPAGSFSSMSHSRNDFKDVRFALEGSKEAVQRGKQMVKAMKGKPITISAGKKPLYHLALVFASNFLVGIEDISIELLKHCGISKKKAKELVLPLVNATIVNIQAKGTQKALTGPVERGDIATIKKHLAMLSKHKRAFKKTYVELSKHLAKMAQEKGELPQEIIREIKQLLKD